MTMKTDFEKQYNRLISALATYIDENGDYGLGDFMIGYLELSENGAYINGFKPLPDCPTCGAGLVFHADSTDDAPLVQCLECGWVGELKQHV